MNFESIETAKGICDRNGITELKAPVSRLLTLQCSYTEIDSWDIKPYAKHVLSKVMSLDEAEDVFDGVGFIIKHMFLTSEKFDHEIREAKKLCRRLVQVHYEIPSIVESFTFYSRFLDFQLYNVARAGELNENPFANDTFNFEVARKELESFFVEGDINESEVRVVTDGLEAINEFKKEVDKNSSYRRRISYS